MKKLSDKSRILQYLMTGNSLTFHEAVRKFNGCISIREKIRDLRKEGINVVTERVQNPRTKHFHSVYKIAGLRQGGA
jgi:hypothetical protein